MKWLVLLPFAVIGGLLSLGLYFNWRARKSVMVRYKKGD